MQPETPSASTYTFDTSAPSADSKPTKTGGGESGGGGGSESSGGLPADFRYMGQDDAKYMSTAQAVTAVEPVPFYKDWRYLGAAAVLVLGYVYFADVRSK